jgi:hypothetical protein
LGQGFHGARSKIFDPEIFSSSPAFFWSSRAEFVEKLRYRNLEIGRLRLDSWLDKGGGTKAFSAKSSKPTQIVLMNWKGPVVETDQLKTARTRRHLLICDQWRIQTLDDNSDSGGRSPLAG